MSAVPLLGQQGQIHRRNDSLKQLCQGNLNNAEDDELLFKEYFFEIRGHHTIFLIDKGAPASLRQDKWVNRPYLNQNL